GQTEHARDHVALAVWTLDRRPHAQHTGLGVVIGHDAAALDRHRGQTLVPEALAHHGETGSRKIGLANAAVRLERDVVGPVGVYACRRRACDVGADERRQRRVIDAHRRERVADERGGVGDDDREGLAHVARALAREYRYREATLLRAAG